MRELNISTFHSFCARLLRREAAAIGYPPGYVIYDTDDTRTLLKRCVEELGYSGAQFAPQALARRISSAKNSLQTADEFAQGASGYFESRTAGVFQLYEKRLRSRAPLSVLARGIDGECPNCRRQTFHITTSFETLRTVPVSFSIVGQRLTHQPAKWPWSRRCADQAPKGSVRPVCAAAGITLGITSERS